MHRRHAVVIDAIVPVLVGGVIVTGMLLHGGSTVRPAPIALGLAAAATLWGRRQAPAWTLAGSGVLVAVLFAVESAAGPVAVLAPAVALYSLALRRGRAQQLVAAVAAVAAVIIADAVHPGRPTLLQTLGHVMLIALPLLAAEAIRTHRSNLALLTERLELAERTREQEAQRRAEQERMQIARELHDVVSHTLTTINVQAGAAAERAEPGDARRALEWIEHSSRNAIGELRAILGVLRNREGSEAPRAPVPGIADVSELVERAREAGLDVELEVSGPRPARLSDAVSFAAYRIVQESLTNARRHAPGAGVRVRVGFDAAHLEISVENGANAGAPTNGATPPSGGNGSRGGVGITGMLERATAVGGTLRAGPSDGGFQVSAALPYELRT